MIFNCTSNCGICCRHVAVHPDVPAVDGVCTKLDTCTNKCTIYNDRPLVCRVVDGYILYKDGMSEDEYLQANYAACKKLQEEYGNDKQQKA